MSAAVIPELLTFLDGFCEEHGRARVWATCQAFMRKKTDAGVEATPRKPVPKPWTEKAFMRQKGICARCGKPMLFSEAEGDHVVSLAKGGKHEAHNIQALHGVPCNRSKGANDMSREAKLTRHTILEQIQARGNMGEERSDE